MFVFQLKLKNQWGSSNCEFSFPYKSPKKEGTSNVRYYDSTAITTGRFKAKSEQEAIKKFISSINYNIRIIQSPFTIANQRTQNRPYDAVSTVNYDLDNLVFLFEVLEKAEEKYLEDYPEAFI